MDNTQYHEIELLRASVNGDTKAFGLIIRKYQSFVCAITYSATGDVGESEALAQEVFVNAWLGIKKLRNLSKFKSWLKSIAKNAIRSWLRNRKQDLISKATTIDNAPDIETDDFEPAKMAIKAEQQLIVQEALKQIPLKYREPLVLFYRNKESVKQVALELEISEDTVKSRLFRGRKYLKEQVAAMIETTIGETGPDKAFTAMVIGSITALSLKSGAAAAASIAASAASGAGKTASVATFISSTTGKIISTAAVVVIGVSLILLSTHNDNFVNEPNTPENVNVVPNNMALQAEEPNDAMDIAAEIPAIQNVTVIDSNGVAPNDNNDLQNIFQRQSNNYVFQPRGVLSGLITDSATGEPVIDAELALYVEAMEKTFKTTTDKHGFYFFDNIEKLGKSSIYISSLDHVGYNNANDTKPVVFLIEGEQLVRHFELPKACQIDLFVYDGNGIPIRYVETRITLPTEKSDYDQSYKIGNTNNDGYLRIGGIPPSKDDYLLLVMHRISIDHRFSDGKIEETQRNDYAPAGQYIKLNNPDEIKLVEVVLEKGSDVKGYIEYANGTPGYDLQVSAEPSWWNISLFPNKFEVDEFGFFTLKNIVPREYSIRVFVNKSNNSSNIHSMAKVSLPLPENELFTINLPVNQAKPMPAMEGSIIYNGPSKSEHVLLRIRDSKGDIVKDGGKSLYQYTDDDPMKNLSAKEKKYIERENHFKVGKLKEGIYSLEVIGSNMYYKIENINVPGDFVHLEVVSSPKPVIDLLVLDAKTNQPVTDYRYRVRKIKQLTSLQPIQENQWFDVNDENGKTQVEVVGPGIYDIQVAAHNYAPRWSQDVNTLSLENATIKLNPGGAIKGTIVDKQGKLITGAKVIPYSKTCGTHYTYDNVFQLEEGAVQSYDGQFILKDLPPGIESIKVIHPEYVYKIVKDIQVKEGEITDIKEITIDNGTTIEGYVYDNDGNTVPETVLVLRRKDLPYQNVFNMVEIGSTITDSNGFFSISGVSGENCIISRRDDFKGPGLFYRSVEFYDNDIVSLEFGGHSLLSGKLIVDGNPLDNQRIEMFSREPEFLQEFCTIAQTDSEGNFTFTGLISGKHNIGYKISGKPFRILTEVNIPDENEDIDIGVIYFDTKDD